MSEHKDKDVVREAVRDRYAEAAKTGLVLLRHGRVVLLRQPPRPRPMRYRPGSDIARRNWLSRRRGRTWAWAAATPRR